MELGSWSIIQAPSLLALIPLVVYIVLVFRGKSNVSGIIVGIFLAALMLLSLVACASDGQTEQAPATDTAKETQSTQQTVPSTEEAPAEAEQTGSVLADINGMKEYALPVTVVDAEEVRLSSLSVGSLTLSPAFDKNVTVYTATTTNATNAISAVAKDGDATIAIKNGGTDVTNGGSATWAPGENTVKVTVTNGASSKVYTVTVTKS